VGVLAPATGTTSVGWKFRGAHVGVSVVGIGHRAVGGRVSGDRAASSTGRAVAFAALLALGCAAAAGSLGGGAAAFLALWASLWLPATAGLGAAAAVIHRRAARRVAAERPAPRYMAMLLPRPAEEVAGEVAVAATVFVGVAAAMFSLAFVMFLVALHRV
jgi:hypothetical protein